MVPIEHNFDVIIIGGGVVGCAIARELSRYKLRVALIEQESDVGQGASCSNSGVVHAGFTSPVGSLKAETGMFANQIFAHLCQELAVPFVKTGKLVVAVEKAQIPELYKLKHVGESNGAELYIVGEAEIQMLEPNVRGKAALFSPNSAITSPYALTIAFAENAHINGVRFFLNTRVENLETADGDFVLKTSQGDFKAAYVINSAGIYSDEIARLSGETGYTIYPCRGEYYILDKYSAHLINRLVYPVPPKNAGGYGIHLTPTVDGNILIGPSNEYIAGKHDRRSTGQIMHQLFKEARAFVPHIEKKYVIRSYAGLRSKIVPPEVGGFTDFVIKASPLYPNFINLIGIESPGLTASPGIAGYVREMIDSRERLQKKADFQATLPKKTVFAQLPVEEQARLVKENPDYGEIVCRCEKVTRQEIIDALNNPLGVRTLKGIKYRTRATMGRCQGGYCMSRIIRIMEEVSGEPDYKLTLAGAGSNLFTGKVKG